MLGIGVFNSAETLAKTPAKTLAARTNFLLPYRLPQKVLMIIIDLG